MKTEFLLWVSILLQAVAIIVLSAKVKDIDNFVGSLWDVVRPIAKHFAYELNKKTKDGI